jgi:site-specific DNA recombinase
MGLLRCGECGFTITAEMKKGHIYYRCTKRSRTCKCSQPYVREEVLDAQLSVLLKSYSMPASWADEMLKRVNEEKQQAAKSVATLVAQKQAEIEKVNQKLQTLLDTFLDGIIDRATFTKKKAELMSQKKTLEEQKAAHAGGRTEWFEPFKKWILTAKNAGEIAVSGSLQAKRVLAQEVFGSNLVLDCKIARGSCVKPWSLLVENSSTGGMVRDAGFEPATPTVSR